MNDMMFYGVVALSFIIPLAILGSMAAAVFYVVKQIHFHTWSKWTLLKGTRGENQYRKCGTCGKTEIGWTY